MAIDTDTTAGGRASEEVRPPAVRRPRKPFRRQALPYLLLLPALLLELLIHIVPMLIGIGISLIQLTQFYIRNWKQAPFAGLHNYRIVVDLNGAAGRALLHSFVVTLEYTVLVLAFCWLFGTAAAVLTQRPFRGRGLVRTAFLIPYALPLFASVITWSFMFQRDTGLVNHVLVDQLHLFHSRPFWLIGPHSFVSLVVVSVWRNWPFAFLVVTAGLQGIPDDLYEAAAIDGAGFWQQFTRITMPMLRPVNRVMILVLFLWTFNEFTTPYTLFGKSAPQQADLISMHIYQNSFITWNFGYGSAMSVLLMVFLLLVTAVYLFVTNRAEDN
jgi:multiple sugar transport system permease protein